MNTPRFILGIDAGGSKCQGALWEAAKLSPTITDYLAAAIWSAKTDGINLDVISNDLATERLQTILRQAAQSQQQSVTELLGQSYVVIGLAGLDTSRDVASAQQWLTVTLAPLGQPTHLALLTDVELALWSAHPKGEGMLLIAGTGSNCFGRVASGQTAKTGGLSHFFSDEGGGFDLGWHALHLIGKMYDGRHPKTALWAAVLQQYGVADFPELKQLITHAPDYKQAVAKAAPVVQALAAKNDHDCQHIVELGITELTTMAEGVASQLRNHVLPVYLVGGLFADNNYRHQLLVKLSTVSLHGQEDPIGAPVAGAIAYRLAHPERI